jgi:hypothetical protein
VASLVTAAAHRTSHCRHATTRLVGYTTHGYATTRLGTPMGAPGTARRGRRVMCVMILIASFTCRVASHRTHLPDTLTPTLSHGVWRTTRCVLTYLAAALRPAQIRRAQQGSTGGRGHRRCPGYSRKALVLGGTVTKTLTCSPRSWPTATPSFGWRRRGSVAEPRDCMQYCCKGEHAPPEHKRREA